MNDTLKKSLAAVGLTTGMVLSGLGIAQVASAQTDDTPAAETEADSDAVESSDAEGTDGERDCEGKGHRRGGPDKEAIAETLGMTSDELRAEFEAGNSLADVAAAQGVDVQDLIDMMVADATEHINEKVAEGDITQEEADEKLADLTEKITERVNSEPEADGERGRRGNRGDRGPRGERGGDTADTSVEADA